MTVILTPKYITIPKIFLQVNPKENAVHYYFHRGFKYSKLKTFLTAFPSKNNNGQFIHWIDDSILKLMVLNDTPRKVKCASNSIFGIQQLLLLSPKKKRAAATKKGGMVPVALQSKQLQKLVSVKAKSKYSTVKRKFTSWVRLAIPIFGWSSKAEDNERLCDFPNFRVKEASIVEEYSNGTDVCHFFNAEELWLDINDNNVDLHRLRPISITPRLIISLIYPNLLIGETITLILSYLFRNVTQDFLIWPATALKYLFEKLSTETLAEKKWIKHTMTYIAIFWAEIRKKITHYSRTSIG